MTAHTAGRPLTSRPAVALRTRPSLLTVAAVTIAVLLAVPILSVLSSLVVPRPEVWAHLWRTQLVELSVNTLLLLAGVGTGTLVLGTALAWLVVGHRFPGRGVFEWALMLPLAMPAYVIGFAFLGLFDFAGPVQTLVRRVLGAGFRVPAIATYGGVVAVMILVFYPYVYLLARAAFREQGAATLETARSLGRSRSRAFREVMLPMARPSLVAGVSLAMMEALADFGTVATFGYRTLTEAIYRVWLGMFDRTAATQLACLVLLLALGLIALERAVRGRARYVQSQRRGPGVVPLPLAGWRAWAATGACLTVLGVAFGVPVGQLLVWAVSVARTSGLGHFVPMLRTTLAVAALASLAACVIAVVLAYAGRLHPSPTVRRAAQFASMGYALPGAVIAVGVLVPIALVDHGVVRALEALLGRPLGLLLTGSVAALLFAYVVRFLAVSYNTVDASLGRIAPSLDDAARSLGVGVGATLRRVHLPLMRGGVLTALVLVFVETMKEMPATLLLRPFGLDTLAVGVWQRTSESLWAEASVPALAIVLAGLVPVLITLRLTARDR